MKFLISTILITISIVSSQGQSIIGQWTTFDDNTKEKKALIKIYQKNDIYFAKIVESYVSDKNAICETCKGAKKGLPINGLVIIENMKKYSNEYKGGSILDPENGKTYKCILQLENANKLKVRGYLGFSLLGRSQYWKRNE